MKARIALLLPLFVALVAACGATVIRPAADSTYVGLQSTRIASSGTNGTAVYRIPAMAVTNSGTIVIAYDARRLDGGDLPGVIDIVSRRSSDNGVTWSPETVAARHSDGNTDATAYGVGDANLTYDAVTGRLWMHYLAAPPGIGIGNSSTSTRPGDRSTVHPLARYSDDEGITWSGIIDLTSSLKDGRMTGIFASAGHGFQVTAAWAHGALVVPYSYYIGGVQRSALVASLDHGATWFMGGEIGQRLSETKAVELADGQWLASARSDNPSVKYRMLSKTNGAWGTPTAHASLPDPMCNGDIIRVDPDSASPRASWLLSSNLDSQSARQNLVVRLSKDNGVTWSSAWTVRQGVAGYSTMTRLSDGSFGIFYEGQVPDTLVFTRFALDQFPEGS